MQSTTKLAVGAAAFGGLGLALVSLSVNSAKAAVEGELASRSVRILFPANDKAAEREATQQTMLKGFVASGGIVTRETDKVPSDIWPEAKCVTYGCIEYRAVQDNKNPNMVILRPLHAGPRDALDSSELDFTSAFKDAALTGQEAWIAGTFRTLNDGSNEFVALGRPLTR